MRPRTPLRVATPAAVICLIALTGCGLPEESTVEQIPPGDIPAELLNSTTTSTTTTTTSPPEPPPTTTPPTTDPADAPVPVDLYFTPPGVEDEMFAFRATIGPPGSILEITELLQNPPPAARAEDLRTAVRRDLITDITVDRGTAEVELNAQTFGFMAEDQKRRAIAQIVLTFTSYAPPGMGGIGQILFVVDGEPLPVILPGGRGISDPSEGVAFEDFAIRIVEQPGTGSAAVGPPTPTGTIPTSVATAATSEPGT